MIAVKDQLIEIYLFDGSWLGEDVVDGVERDPDHGGEADAQAGDLGPFGVLVVGSIRHWFIRDEIEDKHGLRKEFRVQLRHIS